MRALDRLDSWRGGDVRPWLFAILHSLHASRWRRLRRFPLVVLEPDEPALRAEAVQPHAAELRAVLQALDGLPVALREVLLLVAVEGVEYADAARILGIPVGTVMSRLSRGRDRLRALMGEQPARGARDVASPRPGLRRVK